MLILRESNEADKFINTAIDDLDNAYQNISDAVYYSSEPDLEIIADKILDLKYELKNLHIDDEV